MNCTKKNIPEPIPLKIQFLRSGPAALTPLGNARMAREEFADPTSYFRCLLEQTPGDIPALLRLGMCYFKTGDSEANHAAYAQVLGVEPGYKLALENLEFLSREAVPAAVGSGAS